MLFKKVSYFIVYSLNDLLVLLMIFTFYFDLLRLDLAFFKFHFFIFFSGNSLEKEKVKTLDVEQPIIPSPLPLPVNIMNHDDTPMDGSSSSTIISNENTPLQVNKCKQPGMVDSLGMFLPSKNMLIPTCPPNFISSKPMKVFGKTFPKYDKFPVNTMNCTLDGYDLHMTLCAYAFPPAGFKSQADVKEGIPVNGTAPRLIFYNDKNAFNLNMDSKYIKRLVQFGLLFLRGNPHLPQDEQDMSDIFSENPELEYPWKEMWELFENSEKRKIRSPTPNLDSGSADRGLHGNESEDEGDVSNEEEEEEEEEEGRGSQDSELLAGSVKPSDSEGSDNEN